MLETGPTIEEMVLLDDPNKIGRLPGMDSQSIKAGILERDEASKKICVGCQVIEACLGAALAVPTSKDPELILGATTKRERGVMRRAAARAAKAQSETT